jgi:hypothetical protein
MEQETEQASQFLQVLLLTTTQPHLHTHTHRESLAKQAKQSKANRIERKEP